MSNLDQSIAAANLITAGIRANMEAGTEVEAKKFSTKTREKMAKTGTAEPDGSYPIKTAKDVSNAVKDFYRSGGNAKDKAHIRSRAKALGLGDPFKKEDVKAGGPGSGRHPEGGKIKHKGPTPKFGNNREQLLKIHNSITSKGFKHRYSLGKGSQIAHIYSKVTKGKKTYKTLITDKEGMNPVVVGSTTLGGPGMSKPKK